MPHKTEIWGIRQLYGWGQRGGSLFSDRKWGI